MNSESSRSHLVLLIKIISVNKHPWPGFLGRLLVSAGDFFRSLENKPLLATRVKKDCQSKAQ